MSESLKDIFLKSFYGKYKQHACTVKILNGKMEINSLCNTKAKFLTADKNSVNCKKCLSGIT
jgi:hypothetical protein